MTKVLKLVFSSGEEIHADFLDHLAPATVEALQADLPYQDNLVQHGKWSGHTIYTFTNMIFKKAECSRSFGVAPGDILYNPHIVDRTKHPNELILVYGPAAIRNVSGYGIANLCAKVRYEYWPLLYKLGIDINRHGERFVTITVEDEPTEEEA